MADIASIQSDLSAQTTGLASAFGGSAGGGGLIRPGVAGMTTGGSSIGGFNLPSPLGGLAAIFGGGFR